MGTDRTGTEQGREQGRVNMHGKANWIYLSYPLHSRAPAYGGGRGFGGEPDKRMDRNDSCNTSLWNVSSHMGTHMDFPRHFSREGAVLDDYEPGFFIFDRVHVMDVSPVRPGMILGREELNLAGVPAHTELLLIKTGFGRHRGEAIYWRENPGFHPELAGYLRNTLADLRVMGFDGISLSSFTDRELGREAHKAFLDHEHPILPLEDMDLGRIGAGWKINRVIAAPMHVKNADGSPCTVFAEVVSNGGQGGER